MSAIKLNSSGGGSITISPASTASTLTLTAPAQTATIGIQGPAVKVYLSSNQSITSSTRVKINLNTTTFDTASSFNTSTYRFTPLVAGYYSVTASVGFSGTSVSAAVAAIWKNGAEVTVSAFIGSIGSGSTYPVTDIIYMNGSTDYLELYAQVNATSPVIAGDSKVTYFAASLVRGA